MSAEEIKVSLSTIDGWKVEAGNLKKRFDFKNFAEPLDFINRVGTIAEAADHHPDITFGWGYAEIRLTTHDTGGLTENDFALARKIEELS